MLDPRYGADYVLGEGQSIMPAYPWLYDRKVEVGVVPDKMRVLKKYGIPYDDVEEIAKAKDLYAQQAATTVQNLAQQGKTGADPDSEIIALIAYLMRLGRNLEPANATAASIDGGR
jgi:cytochrome c oxidase cbb3-type subunit I/II